MFTVSTELFRSFNIHIYMLLLLEF